MPSRNSIGDATAKSFNGIKRLLKDRGITVEPVDGASKDDKELRFLQELQQVERALEADAEKSAREGNVSVLVPGDSPYADIGANDTAKPSKKGV